MKTHASLAKTVVFSANPLKQYQSHLNTRSGPASRDPAGFAGMVLAIVSHELNTHADVSREASWKALQTQAHEDATEAGD